MICPYCNERAKLATGAEVYPHRPDLGNLRFYLCAPCDAYVGCHKNSDGVPLGRLANKELRELKKKAHNAFDPIWRGKIKSRSEAYAWLAEEMKMTQDECHIGKFDEEECLLVLEICNNFMAKEKSKSVYRTQGCGGLMAKYSGMEED